MTHYISIIYPYNSQVMKLIADTGIKLDSYLFGSTNKENKKTITIKDKADNIQAFIELANELNIEPLGV